MAPKTVIVTGASRGIGLAVSRFLLQSPHSSNLVVVARSKEPLEKLKNEYPDQVHVVAGDLAADYSVAKRAVDLAVEKFGGLDGVVVNHGILGPVKRVADVKADEWKDAFDVNVFSAVAMVQAAIPLLRKSKGCIVLTSSGAAVNAYSTWGSYGASKAVLNHLALTLSVEEPDITTIPLRPGMVNTQMQDDLRQKWIDRMDAKDAAKFKSAYEGGKLLRPEQPGNVMGRLILNPPKEMNGKFVSWNSEELSAYRDDKD